MSTGEIKSWPIANIALAIIKQFPGQVCGMWSQGGHTIYRTMIARFPNPRAANESRVAP